MQPSFLAKLETLRQTYLRPSDPAPKVALVGIGNELRGDDAAGVAAIRRLRSRVTPREDVLLLETGPVPENFTGSLRRFQPDLVVLIDAGSFGGKPGALNLCGAEEARGFSASTHTMPLSSFARYIESELGCRTALILIQPEQLEFDQDMSTAVKRGVARLARAIETTFLA